MTARGTIALMAALGFAIPADAGEALRPDQTGKLRPRLSYLSSEQRKQRRELRARLAKSKGSQAVIRERRLAAKAAR